jgi:hypothetical protein
MLDTPAVIEAIDDFNRIWRNYCSSRVHTDDAEIGFFIMGAHPTARHAVRHLRSRA